MIALFLLLAAATPTPQSRAAAAEKAYDVYDYKKAVPQLEALLADPALKDAALRQKARAMLAFSYYYLKREADAETSLRELFKENVDYPVDRDSVPPDAYRFYTEAHNKYVGELKVEPVAAPKATVVARVPSTGDKHPWLRIFPLGIGHFVNRDYVAGGIFAGLELVLIGGNVLGSIERYQLRQPDGLYRVGTNPLPWQVVQNVSAFSLIAVAVIEVIDAFIWSPSRAPPVSDGASAGLASW
jgi:hypothetical protein